MRKTLKITACLPKLGRVCLLVLLNLQFGLIGAFIVLCLAYVFRWQQFHHSSLPQFSTAREGARRHFCQPLNTAVPCRETVNSPSLSLGVQWKESKSPLPIAFDTTRRVWLHLILANLGNLKLIIRRSLRVLPWCTGGFVGNGQLGVVVPDLKKKIKQLGKEGLVNKYKC